MINASAQDKARIGNLSFGVGLAAVIAGGMLWYVGAPTPATRVAIHPQVGGVTGLALTGAF
jgi:hypothetical protein